MPEGVSISNGTDFTMKAIASSDDFENNFRSSKNIPTSQGKYLPVTVDHKMTPNMPRVGKAAAGLLKTAPVIGTVLGLVELACALTDICENPETHDLQLRTPAEPSTPDNPSVVQGSFGSQILGSAPIYRFATVSSMLSYINSSTNYTAPQHLPMTVDYSIAGYPLGTLVTKTGIQLDRVSRSTFCPAGYIVNGINCDKGSAPSWRPLTELDWQTAEPQLSVPEAIPHLIQSGIPVPVNVPQLQPKEQVVERESTTVRDSTGTATGTQERTTTLKIDPLPNPSPISATSPAKVTQTTVTTITNITNNTTNTTETTTESSPDEPPPEEEDTDIEFDQVTDNDLEEFELPNQFEKQNWTTSTGCPADPVINTSIGSFNLPFHIACEFATLFRFVVLLVSTITAAYIIMGSKNGTN